jgi:hypothetical protein
MVNSTLGRPTDAIRFSVPENHSLTKCHICSEFGSEECDVLNDLGRYRQTEEAAQEAAERQPRRLNAALSPPPHGEFRRRQDRV